MGVRGKIKKKEKEEMMRYCKGDYHAIGFERAFQKPIENGKLGAAAHDLQHQTRIVQRPQLLVVTQTLP